MAEFTTTYGPYTGMWDPNDRSDRTIVIKCGDSHFMPQQIQLPGVNGLTQVDFDPDFYYTMSPLVSNTMVRVCHMQIGGGWNIASTYSTGLSRNPTGPNPRFPGPSAVVVLCDLNANQALMLRPTSADDWRQRRWEGEPLSVLTEYMPFSILHEGMHAMTIEAQNRSKQRRTRNHAHVGTDGCLVGGVLPSGAPEAYGWGDIIILNQNDKQH